MALSMTFILLFLFIPTLSSSASGTILTTGDILSAGCIPGRRFYSTANCTLTLTDRGQLLLHSEGSVIWSSSPHVITGRYAALLRPDGHLTIFGPPIWSAASAGPGADLASSPNAARSHMFSSQVLYGDSKLVNGETALVMKDDCGLELVNSSEGVVWESGTEGLGSDCFLRFDHRGQLAVVDGGRRRVVWASRAADVDGFYLLAVLSDGEAAVFGPAIWSFDLADM